MYFWSNAIVVWEIVEYNLFSSLWDERERERERGGGGVEGERERERGGGGGVEGER